MLWATLVLAPGVFCFNESRQLDPEDRSGNWSLGVGYNHQDSVYVGEGYRTDFLPTFVYTGKRFYLDTTEFGWHAIDTPQWQLDVFSSYYIQGYNDHSFFSDTGEVRADDDPLKGMERDNAVEAGLELTRKTSWGRFGIEARHDVDGVHNGSDVRARWARVYREGDWQLEPWAELQWLSEEKADYYFGVRDAEATEDRPAYRLDNSGSWSAGLALRYAFWKEHHVALNLAYQAYGSDIKNSPVVTDNRVPSVEFTYRYEPGNLRVPAHQGEYGFFSNNGNPQSLRLAYGCTTETKFNSILRGSIDCSDADTGLVSIFVGTKLADRVLGLPLEAWLIGGLARRFENDIQDDFFEGVFGMKALYRRFPWSDKVETRIGIGHGFSYAERVPALEQEKAEEKNRRNSRLLNYLEFSLDVSVGDILGADRLRNLFVGYGVHHRSGVFASANLYGNSYGGSNVNMLYFEWEYD